MSAKQQKRGSIVYDELHGHVCTCAELPPHRDDDGEIAFPNYRHTVAVDRSVEPTEGGSYYYVCSGCGAGAWSGC